MSEEWWGKSHIQLSSLQAGTCRVISLLTRLLHYPCRSLLSFPHAAWDASTSPSASSAMSAPLLNTLFIFLLPHPTSTQRCEGVLWGCLRLLCLQIPHMRFLSISPIPAKLKVGWTKILTWFGLRAEEWWESPWKYLNIFLKDRKDVSAYDMAREKNLRLT